MRETSPVTRRRRAPRKASSQNKNLAENVPEDDIDTYNVAASAVKALQAADNSGNSDPDFEEGKIKDIEEDKDDHSFEDEDNVADELGEYDIPIEVDEEEDSFEEEKRPKKKARRNTSKKTTNTIRKPAKAKSPAKKDRLVRALKDLSSARDKICRIYGSNEDRLLELAKIKEGFEEYMFDFPAENISNSSAYYIPKVTPSGKENIYDQLHSKLVMNKWFPISETKYQGEFKLRDEPLELQIGDVQSTINTFDKIEFPVFPNYERKGFVYNVGGMITDIAWLNQDQDDSQYLAVAVSQYLDEPSNNELRTFNSVSHTSNIQLYRLNPETLTFDLMQKILHNSGETWNLKWHDGYKSPESLGLLFFVTQDGCVKYIDFPREMPEENKIILYEDINTSIRVPNNIITSFDFTSPSTIVCGFRDGFVAEFDILDDLCIPSFYEKVHESYIFNIAYAYTDYEMPLVATSSIDGNVFSFNPRDVAMTRTQVDQRFRGGNVDPMVYSPLLYSFVYSDGATTARAATPHGLFAVHQLGTMSGTLNSIATSKRHPFNLFVESDGSVHIDNLARRMLTGVRNMSDALKYCKLWKWDYDRIDKTYRLDHNYDVFKSSQVGPTKMRIDIPGINVTSVKWNETEKAGTFYAFSNAAGLLVIEKLDSIK
ncbi:hypothetical protein C6P45_000557 [Maudiozyma exigua]|uniref:Uncharacterized protein n=1 Tax=Maudiozyma exigua TaxID=34358 RepID=A0A9P7B8U9_MAUEX|nr:hypothetical protein C6P45_000557 [Kazachstania exigua]